MPDIIFESILMAKLQQHHHLQGSGLTLIFSDLVVLALVPRKMTWPISNYSAQTPREIYGKMIRMYYPFPPPIRESTFFEILRGKLKDCGFVDLVEGKEKKYLITQKGCLQLNLAVVSMASTPHSTDEAFFLIHLALMWADLLHMWKKIGLDKMKGVFKKIDFTPDRLEMAIAGFDIDRDIKKLQTVVVKALQEKGEDILAKDMMNRDVFTKAARDVLSKNFANTAFFKKALAHYEKFLTDGGLEYESQARESKVAKFSVMKCEYIARMCREAAKELGD